MHTLPTCCRLVSGFLTKITQQIHSLRASGVISSHCFHAAGSETRAFRKSAGTVWTTPAESFLAMASLYTGSLTAGREADRPGLRRRGAFHDHGSLHSAFAKWSINWRNIATLIDPGTGNWAVDDECNRLFTAVTLLQLEIAPSRYPPESVLRWLADVTVPPSEPRLTYSRGRSAQ